MTSENIAMFVKFTLDALNLDVESWEFFYHYQELALQRLVCKFVLLAAVRRFCCGEIWIQY
jgi:hypothetical protein